MKRVSLLQLLACCSLLALLGCGGSSDAPTEVASNTPAPKPATPASTSESDSGGEEETYGGDDESYGDDEESYGGDDESYGGQDETYGGDEDAMYEEDDEGDEAMGYEEQMRRAQQRGGGGRRSGAPEEINASSGFGGGGTYNGAEGDMYDGGEMEDEGYGDELGMGSGLGMDSSYGGGQQGSYGSGMAGGSRGGGPSHNTVVTFLRSNCMSCHNEQSAKGGVEFASLTADYALSPDVWGSIVEQLEAGSMPPASVPNRPDPNQQQQVIAFIKASLKRAGISPEQDYLSRANMAFARGREVEAIKLAYAHGLTVPEEEARSFFENVKWSTSGRRPATTLRFGVAVDLKAPSTLTDLQPIGDSQGGGGAGMYGGGLGELERGNGGNNNSEASRGFADMTGDYGGALVAAFQSRWSEGKFGTLFNQVVAAAPTAPRSNSAFSPYGDDYGDDEGMGELGMGSGAGGGTGMAPPGLGAPPGVGGPGGGTGMAPPGLGAPPGVGSGGGTGMAPPGLGPPPGGNSGGGAGMAPPGLGGPPGGALGGMGGGMGGAGNSGPSAPRVNAQAGQQLAAGLTFLGIGTQKDMMAQVEEQQLDGLFLFSVEAKKNNRTGSVLNETKVRFVVPDAKSGTVVATGTPLKNRDVELAKAKGKEDPVAKAIARLFTKFDKDVALAEMPALNASQALGRVKSIISNPAMDKMTKLFETRLYYSKGLLTDSELETAYQIILEGNDGVSLASGTPEDRKMVLKGVL